MILVDTSAWIEFLRNTGSTVCTLVDEVLAREVAICDAVRMEVLAGARDESPSTEPPAVVGAGGGDTDAGDGL